MTINYLVSIIMPTYNSEKTVSESIESIKSQTYNNWELLITDDCSTDGTWAVINQYAAQDKRIKVFKNPKNSGAGYSRNNSIANAKGRFIAFLDSDDLWVSEKLSKQINFMLNNDYHLVYAKYQKIDDEGNKKSIIQPPARTSYKKMLYSNVIGCLTAIYDTQKLGVIYMPLIRRRQDFGLWLEIMKKMDGAYCYPEILGYYRIGNNSLSSNKLQLICYQWQFYREVVGLNIFKSFNCFIMSVVLSVMKHSK